MAGYIGNRRQNNLVSLDGATGTIGSGVTFPALGNSAVGTVSESSGTPTGDIIERGSNSNGEYVKYADGTMICTGTVSITGSIIDGNVGSGTIALPASFSTTTAAFFNIGRDNSSSSLYLTRNYLSSTSSGSWILRNDSGATRTYSITSFFAIGRWY